MMKNLILDKTQASDLIHANRYKVQEQNRFLSRCIDGRYTNNKDLPPLAIPGADAGELALIIATANNYGFEVNIDKAFQSLVDVVGGIKNIQVHTDNKDPGVVFEGCGHLKQVISDPSVCNLEPDQVELVRKKMTEAKKEGAHEVILHGEHMEGALIQLQGLYSVAPRFVLEMENKKIETGVFVYHATLVDERHKALAEKLIENKAVRLYEGLDSEYLYQVLSETTEDHLFETAKRLAKGLPIYGVVFDDQGNFTIIDRGKI